MAQEFTIKSSQIEDKINQLLPSQGGAGAGIDFSASTMVIPVVDLTETAEGSSLRQDLQSSLSLDNITEFRVQGATSTIINTTGYFRIFGFIGGTNSTGTGYIGEFNLTDGTTTKSVGQMPFQNGSTVGPLLMHYDFLVKVKAGESVTVESSNTDVVVSGSTRQIADISGNLINP